MNRPLPVIHDSLAIPDPPIAAWLHRGPFSRPTVSVTFPGTHRAMSLTRIQTTKLRRALEIAEALLAREDTTETKTSVDLMRRTAE